MDRSPHGRGRDDTRPLLPAGWTLQLDAGCHRPRREVLVGGTPPRVVRLTPAGAGLVDAWSGGSPLGKATAQRRLATRLVDAGLAHPRPCGPPPSFVVVVPVRDDQQGLDRTLGALAGLPVTVVDDGSAQPATAPRSAAVVRRGEAGGPAAARNEGARRAPPGEVVVFVDAGTVPGPGCVETLLAHFGDPGVGAAAPRVLCRADPGTPAALAAYEAARSPLDMGPKPGPVRPGGRVPYVPSALLAVRRSALEGAGGFDESLRYGEDVDLVWRLQGAGWRVRYEPAASATHPARLTVAAWARQRWSYGGSAAPLAARHGAAVSPAALPTWSASAWLLAATGRPLAGLCVAAASSAALAGRTGRDPQTAAELAKLAARGHLCAGAALATAVRRAWLPPALAAVAAVRRAGSRRAARASTAALAACLAVPPLAGWFARRPRLGPLRWAAWFLADDLAYQGGLWAGALRTRSAAPLMPRTSGARRAR
jgi:mycofactocin system glycosyltransferase